MFLFSLQATDVYKNSTMKVHKMIKAIGGIIVVLAMYAIVETNEYKGNHDKSYSYYCEQGFTIDYVAQAPYDNIKMLNMCNEIALDILIEESEVILGD